MSQAGARPWWADVEHLRDTPRPRREGPPPAPATKPRQENGLEWLIDLVTGAVGGVTN